MISLWAARLRIAAGLGIAPHDFWRLSVAEWLALTAGGGAEQGMDRDSFCRLASRFPDVSNG